MSRGHTSSSGILVGLDLLIELWSWHSEIWASAACWRVEQTHGFNPDGKFWRNIDPAIAFCVLAHEQWVHESRARVDGCLARDYELVFVKLDW